MFYVLMLIVCLLHCFFIERTSNGLGSDVIIQLYSLLFPLMQDIL